MGELLHCTLVHVKLKFWDNWCIWLNPNDSVVSWLRLQTASNCISHPQKVRIIYKVFYFILLFQ